MNTLHRVNVTHPDRARIAEEMAKAAKYHETYKLTGQRVWIFSAWQAEKRAADMAVAIAQSKP